MRIQRQLLLVVCSLSMLACGEPSFLGKSGQPALETAVFWLERDNGTTTPDVTQPNNSITATINSGITFSPNWAINYLQSVNLVVKLTAPAGDPAVELFNQSCAAATGTTAVCTLSGSFDCVYDSAAVTVTCTIGTAATIIDLSPLAANFGNDMYLSFKACTTIDASNCAPAQSIKVNLL